MGSNFAKFAESAESARETLGRYGGTCVSEDRAALRQLEKLVLLSQEISKCVLDPFWREGRAPLLQRLALRAASLESLLLQDAILSGLPRGQLEDVLGLAASVCAELHDEVDFLELSRDDRLL